MRKTIIESNTEQTITNYNIIYYNIFGGIYIIICDCLLSVTPDDCLTHETLCRVKSVSLAYMYIYVCVCVCGMCACDCVRVCVCVCVVCVYVRVLCVYIS